MRLFFVFFFEVRKMIDFGALWAGAGGGGRGSSKLQILQTLTKDLARPAPPWGVRRITEGLRPLPPAPKLEDPMIGRFDDSMDGELLTICLPLEVRGHAF